MTLTGRPCRLFDCCLKPFKCASHQPAQVEQNIRALTEKRRLVRRLTLDHHGTYMKREVCGCVWGGVAVCVCVCVCVCARVWLCVCVRVYARTLTHSCMSASMVQHT